MNKYIYILIAIIITAIILYYYYKNTSKNIENFNIVYGMLGAQTTSTPVSPQIKSYNLCINDCFRDFTGDSAPDQFRWRCTDRCLDKATNVSKCGKNNITKDINNKPEITHRINDNNVQQDRDLTFKEHQRHFAVCNANPNVQDVQMCYCMEEVKVKCRERICSQSALDSDVCMDACIRKNNVGCRSGMYSGWWP